MSDVSVHDSSGRAEVLAALRRELVGPSPAGAPLDLGSTVSFPKREDSYGPWTESATGEEILQRDPPTRRYGVGVLYPPRQAPEPGDDLAASGGEGVTDTGAGEGLPAVDLPRTTKTGTADTSDFDVSLANSYKPSALGVSFLVDLAGAESGLELVVSGASYEPLVVQVQGENRTWWVRQPSSESVRLSRARLRSDAPSVVCCEVTAWPRLSLTVELYCRPWGGDTVLVTATVVNRSAAPRPVDSACLFQAHLRVSAVGDAVFNPYPDRAASTAADPEVASFDLLYRDVPTYAVGHGCAADWEPTGSPTVVCAESLPTYETPSITPDIRLPDGSDLTVPMAPLAGEVPGDDGRSTLRRVVDEYERWIGRKKAEAAGMPEHQAVAKRHLDECDRALRRMRAGLELLAHDPDVARAFQWMNQAMLDQQLRNSPKRPTRRTRVEAGRFVVEGLPDPSEARSGRSWRAFQIGFLLATLPSIADDNDPERDSVELIFFPTGGGKTEAYLGLAAVAILLRRLRDSEDGGVQVVMRYTLRLLTTQQFTRAAALICALDRLRVAHPQLGAPFRIGVWLGGSTTPNSHDDAKHKLRKLAKEGSKGENPFLLLRCPWCAAQLGPVGNPPPKGPKVAGYEESGGRILFRCPDKHCPYSTGTGLPVSVVDSDIYQYPPDFLLGTVDKFAALTWRQEARTLFGIGPDGQRVASPPGLIIQDELHLISGPLGSMVGLYETAIETLCTDERHDPPLKPKIVTSTATIRRYEEQVKALYARETVRLFPPHGLDASDSFFAQYARAPDGSLAPGRLYAGIHAPGLGSVQTVQVRTFAALLQAAQELPEAQRDPWWTLLAFFNSLRELGTSLTLLQSDIPDYLGVLRSRYGLDPSSLRALRPEAVKELTSRLRNDEIPRAIEDLQARYDSGNALDVCIASNIIEVGVDIDRLSLMTVVGQPKSTSQYIQVTGRVGRTWRERPGLVATIYGASKPRDRSHFEHFRSYHARLYAQVEPTSATPFAPPVLDRALHGVLVALVRQLGPQDQQPWPFDETLTGQAAQQLVDRVAAVDPGEAQELRRVLDRRLHEWKQWERTRWQASATDEDVPLMRFYGQWVPEGARALSWATPTSMRDVDADCQVEITSAYQRAAGAEGSA